MADDSRWAGSEEINQLSREADRAGLVEVGFAPSGKFPGCSHSFPARAGGVWIHLWALWGILFIK